MSLSKRLEASTRPLELHSDARVQDFTANSTSDEVRIAGMNVQEGGHLRQDLLGIKCSIRPPNLLQYSTIMGRKTISPFPKSLGGGLILDRPDFGPS